MIRRRAPAGLAIVGFAVAGRAVAAPAAPSPAEPPPAPTAAAPPEDGASSLDDIISRVATRTDRPLSRAPASVTVLRGDQIEELGVRFFTDALRVVPGLEVVRIGSTESNVSARGFNDDSSAAQGILGLLDGRQVYNEFFGGVLWEAIPVWFDDLERVEVIRGPGSFVHGPNALHGLVNIVTRSPLDYPADQVQLGALAGSYRSHVESLTYVHRRDADGLKVRLARDDIDAFEPPGENAKDKAFGEVRYAIQFDAKDHRLDVSGGCSRQQFSLLLPTFAGLPAVTLDDTMTEGFVRAQYDLGNFKALLTWTRDEGRVLSPDIYPSFDLLLDTLDLDLQHTMAPAEGHAVTAGVGYRLAAFQTGDADVSEGRHRTGLAWVFAQDEWTAVPERLWITGGVRFDDHSVSGGNVAPRLAAVWRIDPAGEQYLRGAAGTGYRNPSLREAWLDMPLDVPGMPVRPVISGNSHLQAEQLRSFEFGYAGRWGAPRTHTRVDAVAYYTLFDRGINYRAVEAFPSPPFPPGLPARYEPTNCGKDDAYGAELEVHHTFDDRYSGFANYAFAVRADRETHERNPLTPRHTANVGLRAVPVPGLTLTTWVTVFDHTYGYDPAGTGRLEEQSTDAYALLNVRAAYRFQWQGADGTVYLQAFNLLDHDHREHPEGDRYGLILMGGIKIRW